MFCLFSFIIIFCVCDDCICAKVLLGKESFVSKQLSNLSLKTQTEQQIPVCCSFCHKVFSLNLHLKKQSRKWTNSGTSPGDVQRLPVKWDLLVWALVPTPCPVSHGCSQAFASWRNSFLAAQRKIHNVWFLIRCSSTDRCMLFVSGNVPQEMLLKDLLWINSSC